MVSCSQETNETLTELEDIQSVEDVTFEIRFDDMVTASGRSQDDRYDQEGRNFMESFEVVWKDINENAIEKIDEDMVSDFLDRSPYKGTVDAGTAYRIATETISTLLKNSPEDVIKKSNLSKTSKNVFTDLMSAKISLEEADKIIRTDVTDQGEKDFMLASLSRAKYMSEAMGLDTNSRGCGYLVCEPWDHVLGYTGAGAIIGGAIGGWPGAGIGAVVGFVVGVFTKNQ